MKFLQNIFRIKLILGLILFLSLAILFEQKIRFQPNENEEFVHVQNVLKTKTEKVDRILSYIESKLDSVALQDLLFDQQVMSNNLYESEGIVLLGYSGDSLVFWTDNSIPVENYFVNNQLYNDVAKLKNGWFVIRHNYIDDYELFGLILIKHEYSYQNEFVKSDFFYEYEIDVPVSISVDKSSGYAINDHENNFLFSFNIKSNLVYNKSNVLISSILYFISIILLFFGLKSLISRLKSRGLKNI
jgi:hypothetical protein